MTSRFTLTGRHRDPGRGALTLTLTLTSTLTLTGQHRDQGRGARGYPHAVRAGTLGGSLAAHLAAHAHTTCTTTTTTCTCTCCTCTC